MEMMLQTQNLCKYFRKQKAVNNVSLNIEKGPVSYTHLTLPTKA